MTATAAPKESRLTREQQRAISTRGSSVALSAGAKANVQQRFSPEAAASGLRRLRELIETRRRNAPFHHRIVRPSRPGVVT